MIKLVVFDFDGTLVDSNGVKEECVWRVLAGFEHAEGAVAQARQLQGNRYVLFREIAARLYAQAGRTDVERHGLALASLYTQCCAKRIHASPERRGARRALAGLKLRGTRICINTGTPQKDIADLLRRRDLLRYVDRYFGTPESKEGNLRRAMRAFRVNARETLVVGDGPDDKAAAESVGAWFVAITTEERIPGRSRLEMRDLRKLVPLFDRLNSRRAIDGGCR